MSGEIQDTGGRRRFGLIVAAITGVSYFTLLVTGALNPAFLQQPIGDGRLSVGLVAGSLLVLFIVVCGAIYTFLLPAQRDDQ